MGLSNALSTAVSGLTSHQKALDNIGNNLANVNTSGFKKGIYQFSTLLEQSLRGGMASTGTTGSVNPIALGYGTQTASISKLFSQSSLDYTGALGNMAISGNGFFVVSNGQATAFTRDGSFSLDEDGYLVNSAGMFVQGTVATRNSDGSVTIPQDSRLQNINIPIGTIGGMAKTSNVSFTGNLNYSLNNVTSGLQLYGTTSVPSVSNLQEWMSSKQNTSDATWTALENPTYFVWQEILDANAMTVPAGANVSVYSGGSAMPDNFYYVLDGNTVKSVDDTSLTGLTGNPATLAEIVAAGYVPVIQEVSTINGGNVQTSQALGITVSEFVTTVTVDGTSYTANNSYTYPQWFYEANGASFSTYSYTDILAMDDATLEAALADIWPNGFQNSGTAPTAFTSLPHAGETYPATLDTPLEHLYTYENGKWKQMFNNLQEGDEITVNFDKGDSSLSATFIYNYPSSSASGNQVALDYEKSYTLEHFLTFLAGDVNETATVCANITEDMFDNIEDYNLALADLTLAKNSISTSGSTGVMGLVDVAPEVSASNGGSDSIDAPVETAGAYTREGVSQVTYSQWDPVAGAYVTVKADSFNVSLVSNLGSQNALSNITMTHNSVTNKTAFTGETEYATESSNSTTASVTFYDSLGNAHVATVRMTLVSEDSNFSTWRWYADCEDDTDFVWQADPATGELISSLNVGTGLFRFDSDGNFVMGSDYSETGGIVINLVNQGVDDTIHVAIQNGLSSKQTQDLDFSDLTYSASTMDLRMAAQNGSPPGSLEEFSVADDGTIYGVYSTGKTVALARLVIATVANENGLKAGSGNLFYTTPASGEAQYAYATVGGRGSVVQYYLETSNVEMSEEFTKMISVERGYQANSRIVSVADEMLQELLSMVR